MPDVVGEKLDIALSDIERAGVGDDVEVVGGGLFGVVDESNWEVCEQLPAPGVSVIDAPRLTVDRSCGAEEAQTDGETAEARASEGAPAPSETKAGPTASEGVAEGQQSEPYTYAGPEYTTLWVDQDVVLGQADHHWVLVDGLDPEADDFHDQVKMIISDVAREQGTDKLSLSVVTDEEIASLESDLHGPAFLAEKGQAYINEVVRLKEETGYLAWYTGGVEPDNPGELSDAEGAFEILWLPAGAYEAETWRPQTGTR